MRKFSAAPQEMFASFWRNRQLLWQMSRREVVGRYRGSFLGIAWSFINPILMLTVYTFVFSVVFKTRWGVDVGEDKASFAVVLFAGLIVFGLFAESVSRSTALITSNVNFVKKVVFPLEILALVNFSSALFHTFVGLIVLLLVQLVMGHSIPITVLLFPLVLLPLAIFILGASWFLSALGVYFRDVAQVVGMLVSVLPFVSAVFFPITALPEKYQSILLLNPIASVIENSRRVLIFGQLPDFESWLLLTGFSIIAAWVGFAWFQKTRRGFADVL